MIRFAVVGGRDFSDFEKMCRELDRYRSVVSTVVSGGARGADTLAERWAKSRGVPTEVYPADWERHGKSAGFIRNKLIVDNADAVLAFWDGQSRGTKMTIDLAVKLKKPVRVVRY